jgi:hypothetical protein
LTRLATLFLALVYAVVLLFDEGNTGGEIGGGGGKGVVEENTSSSTVVIEVVGIAWSSPPIPPWTSARARTIFSSVSPLTEKPGLAAPNPEAGAFTLLLRLPL